MAVTLGEPLTESGTVVPMVRTDTNDDREYDFVVEEGGADGPYTAGDAVVDDASLTVEIGGSMGDGADDEPSQDDGAGSRGFVALLAILGSVVALHRRS